MARAPGRGIVTGRRSGSAGFTLLEILVVLAVLGLLLAGLAQGVRYGLLAWGTQARIVGERDQLDATDRMLRQLVGNIDTGNALKPTWLSGQPNRFDFTTTLPRVAALATRRADVTLLVDTGHRLVLRWTPHFHETPLTAPPPMTETELLSGVDHVDFSYWRDAGRTGVPAGWQHVWTDTAPPGIVKIHLGFAKGDSRTWPDIVVAVLARANG